MRNVLRIRSVRARLTIWYTLLVALMLVVMSFAVHALLRTSMRQEIKEEFDRSFHALERVVSDSPKHLEFFDTHSTVDFFVVRGADEFTYESEDWRNESIDPVGFPFRGLSQWPWASPPERWFRFETRDIVAPNGLWKITVAQDTSTFERSLSKLTANLMLASPFALLLAMLTGSFMAGKVLAPVGAMAEKASEITAENLSARLPIENADDEFGRLASVFNETLARLEESFERLRRFTADASHELRTPLTVIRAVGEVGLAEPFDPAVCRDAIASMLEESDRLARLVDGLLTLTRGDRGVVTVRPTRFRLQELAMDVADLLRVLAEEKNQQLLVTGDAGIEVYADRGILRQAVMNFVDNAIRHTPAGGVIEIRTGIDGLRRPYMAVRDEGPGIAPEHRGSIFERFYRVDGEAASQEARQGCGLGLAIARWAAEVNSAQVDLETKTGAGSTFSVIFPPQTSGPGSGRISNYRGSSFG